MGCRPQTLLLTQSVYIQLALHLEEANRCCLPVLHTGVGISNWLPVPLSPVIMQWFEAVKKNQSCK